MRRCSVAIAPLLIVWSVGASWAYSVNWYSINSGGGTIASGGCRIAGTLGQSLIGVVVSPPYTPNPYVHYIGFWTGGLPFSIPVASVCNAKLLADGSYISLSGALATTASLSDFVDRVYLEQEDRSSGIQFFHGPSLIPLMAEGDRVTVIGTLATRNGERCIEGSQVTAIIHSGRQLKPLGVRGALTGGGDFHVAGSSGQRGVGRAGLNNVGLLVRIWGRVEGIFQEGENAYLFVDDPSGPVRVDPGRLGSIPASGYVEITGISSVDNQSGALVPVIKPRRGSDLVEIR